MGYCAVCDRLVAIRPGPQKWGTRERQWFPVEHAAPSGERCPGVKRSL